MLRLVAAAIALYARDAAAQSVDNPVFDLSKSATCLAHDLTDDGNVNVDDLLVLLAFYNLDCEGAGPEGYASTGPNDPFREAIAPKTCPESCIRQGWDYGGDSGDGCGFAAREK